VPGLLDKISLAIAAAIGQIILAIPAAVGAAIIVALGYYIGRYARRAVDTLLERTGVEKVFDAMELGKAYRQAGIDLSEFVGKLVWAFVTVLSILIAVEYLHIGGIAGQYIAFTAAYLVRIVGAVIVLTLGAALFELFATFVAKQFEVVLPQDKRDLTDLIKDILLVGLLAFLLSIVFNILLLPGSTIYPLILGVVAIALGITLSERLVNMIARGHEEFRPIAGYAKFLILMLFLVIGAAGVFGTVPGTATVIANLAWGFAIAAALMLVPVMYTLAKKIANQAA
jgi:hypothetical protein